MNKATIRMFHCAVYTRKSSEESLDQEFNSLEAYAKNHFFHESHNKDDAAPHATLALKPQKP